MYSGFSVCQHKNSGYRLRQIISHELEEESVQYLAGEIEVNEDEVLCKVPVFGLLKRGGKVYTAINAKAKILAPIIRAKV